MDLLHGSERTTRWVGLSPQRLDAARCATQLLVWMADRTEERVLAESILRVLGESDADVTERRTVG